MSRFLIPIIAFLCSTAYAQINIQDKGTGTSTSIGLFGAETTVGKEISDEILAKFEPGKTTYDEVVKELGKPTTERIVKNRTMNMLIVSYVSQKGKVDTNRIALSAIPFIGGLAALAAGRTEVQAEQQNVGFIFDADNKILFAVNNNRSNGQVRERTGIEKLKDAEISIGKPSESAPQNYTPPVQQILVASTGDVIVPRIPGIKIFEDANSNSKQTGALKKDEQVVYLGEEKNGFVKIQGADGEGWVDKRMMKK